MLRHLPDGVRLVRRLDRKGPGDPRTTAGELGMAFEYARHLCRALGRLGLVATDGTEAAERSPETGGHAHTSYAATDRASALLAGLEE